MNHSIVYDGPSLPMIDFNGNLYRLQKLVDGKWVSIETEDEIEALLQGDDS